MRPQPAPASPTATTGTAPPALLNPPLLPLRLFPVLLVLLQATPLLLLLVLLALRLSRLLMLLPLWVLERSLRFSALLLTFCKLGRAGRLHPVLKWEWIV
jgi:hypothetical protein